MSSPADRIVLLAVKHTVVAFDKQTGAQVWRAQLRSGLSGCFVTLVADKTRVYAHTHGEIYCLDLATGSLLWKDGLAGLGYEIASIAIPGGPSSSAATAAERFRQDQSSSDLADASSGA